MVICLERGADLHMAQLMPLPLTVSCSSKIQIGFTFLVPAYPGYPGKEAVKWLSLSSAFVCNILGTSCRSICQSAAAAIVVAVGGRDAGYGYSYIRNTITHVAVYE